MNRISAVLKQWNSALRQTVARGLLNELRGRSNAPALVAGDVDNPRKIAGAAPIPEPTARKQSEAPVEARRPVHSLAGELAEELKKQPVWEPTKRPEPVRSGNGELDVPQTVETTFGENGAYVTYRRKVPAVDSPVTENTGFARHFQKETGEDRQRQMRTISDWFRRDSRRYDPGYPRY